MDSVKLNKCLGLLRKLRESVKCPICLCAITDTVELKCSHKMCASCFKRIFNSAKGVTCPICKKRFDRRCAKYKDQYTDILGRCLNNIDQFIESKLHCTVDSLVNPSSIEKALREKQNELDNATSKKRTPRRQRSKNISKNEIKSEASCSSHRKTPNAFDMLLATVKDSMLSKKNVKTYINVRKQKKGNERTIDILQFHDDSNKDNVIKWLNDTRNKFDRLTQTQSCTQATNNDSPEFNLPSVSQLHNKEHNKARVNTEKIIKLPPERIDEVTKRSTRRSINLTRTRSLDIGQAKKCDISLKKRHSLAGETPEVENYTIDEYNTEEERMKKQGEKIALIDLMEDEYLNNIENELLKKKEPSKNKKSNSSEDNKKSLPPSSNKENKNIEVSGWNRMKDIRRSIQKKEKLPKKLNITRQSTQKSTTKNDCDKETDPVKSKSGSNNGRKSRTKSYNLNDVEAYITKNMVELPISELNDSIDSQFINNTVNKKGETAESNLKTKVSPPISKSAGDFAESSVIEAKSKTECTKKSELNSLTHKHSGNESCPDDKFNQKSSPESYKATNDDEALNTHESLVNPIVINDSNCENIEPPQENSSLHENLISLRNKVKLAKNISNICEEDNVDANNFIDSNSANKISEKSLEKAFACDDKISKKKEVTSETQMQSQECVDDLYGQPTQKIIFEDNLVEKYQNEAPKDEFLFEIQVPIVETKVIRKEFSILKKMEEVLENCMKDIRQCTTSKKILTQPSKLEDIDNTVSVFLKVLPTLGNLHDCLDELKESLSVKSSLKTSKDHSIQTELINLDEGGIQKNDCSRAPGAMETSQNSFVTCQNMTTQTVSLEVSNKNVQTDKPPSQKGFYISSLADFNIAATTEVGIQTEIFCCKNCGCDITSDKNRLCDDKLPMSKDIDNQNDKLSGKYVLTEFFDDLNFETQDIIKQEANAASLKNLNISGLHKIACTSQKSDIPSRGNTSSHMNDQQTINSDINHDKIIITQENTKSQLVNKEDMIDTQKNKAESVLLCSLESDTLVKNRDETANTANKSVCRQLLYSDDQTMNKFKRIRRNNSDSDSENVQPNKRVCNRFVRDDLSFVFDSEKPVTQANEKYVTTAKNEECFELSQGSDDINYDEYLAKVMEKYEDNGQYKESQDTSTGKRKSTLASQQKTKLQASKSSESDEPCHKKSRTQAMLDECDRLIQNVNKQKSYNVGNSKNSLEISSSVEKNMGNLKETGDALFADNLFSDANISKIEKDLNDFEKKDVNSETSDIIGATEPISRYGFNEIQKSIKRQNIAKNKDLLAENRNEKLSESLFANTESFMKFSEAPNKEFKSTEPNFDSSQEDTAFKVIPESPERCNQPDVKILQNIVIKAPAEDKPSTSYADYDSETEEMFSPDADIVELTPQKKSNVDIRSVISQRSFSQRRHSYKDECVTKENSEFSLDVTLPPPPGFDDNEDDFEINNIPESKISNSDKERTQLNIVHKEIEQVTPQKSASDPDRISQLPNTQKSLNLSPIPTDKNRNMNVFDMVKQSKFSPLTVFTKTPNQKSLTTSTPKQKSILNYMRKSQESKLSGRTTQPSPRRKPCVACTRLSKDQVIAISSMTNKKLATYSNTFAEDVTHMIVSVNEKNCVKDHTMKYVSAVAAGIWVLSFKWVQECLANNCIVPEEPFEVLDVSGIPGPRKARLTRLSNPLLKGYKVHVAPPFISTTQLDVENVIHFLGGKVVPTPEDLVEDDGLIGLIVTEASATQDFEIYEVWLETFKVVTVDLEWLSKSVGQYQLVSLRSFVLCSDDSIFELGYPEEILSEPLSLPQ